MAKRTPTTALVENEEPEQKKPTARKKKEPEPPPEPPPEPKPMPRSTERISISLLAEERDALEKLSMELRSEGHRALKTSRLARIAFKLLLQADKKTILKIADSVENLEVLRGKRG
jgi:cell division septation protein DedD